MDEVFAILVSEAEPGTVVVTGRMPPSCQSQLADALARAAAGGRCRLDLTGLEALHVAALEVLFVLAREVEVEVVVRAGGTIARAVHAAGLDPLAAVREVAAGCRPPARRLPMSA